MQSAKFVPQVLTGNKRACQLAELDMVEAGLGPPPCSYVMLVLGSGGRGESLLAMDQDNALIFERGEPGGPEDLWFEELGKRTADILDRVGVSYCKGGIMASNAAWRKDRAGWQHQLEDWIAAARLEDMMNIDIFFDALAVHGDSQLFEGLEHQTLTAASGSRLFLKAMERDAAGFSTALNWRGRPKLKDGRADLKIHGIMPVFQTARMLSVRHGFLERSTPARLKAAAAQQQDFAVMIRDLTEAHKILLQAILHQQLRDLRAGIKLSNKVAPADMESHDRQALYWALGQIDNVKP